MGRKIVAILLVAVFAGCATRPVTRTPMQRIENPVPILLEACKMDPENPEAAGPHVAVCSLPEFLHGTRSAAECLRIAETCQADLQAEIDLKLLTQDERIEEIKSSNRWAVITVIVSTAIGIAMGYWVSESL